MEDVNFKPTLDQVRAAYQLIRSQKAWSHEESAYTHHRVLPFATLAPWLDDSEFMGLMAKIENHTLVDIYRCHELWLLAKQVGQVPGDILEVGVWRGGTGALLGTALKGVGEKHIFLADTFSGVVKASNRDTRYVGGEHSDTSLQTVQQLLDHLGLDNCTLLKGVFPEDTAEFVKGKIAMLHCDVDVYQSCADIIKWAKPRFSSGSILVFDDYGFFGCEGVTEFCNELRAEQGFVFVHNLNGHAIFVKT